MLRAGLHARAATARGSGSGLWQPTRCVTTKRAVKNYLKEGKLTQKEFLKQKAMKKWGMKTTAFQDLLRRKRGASNMPADLRPQPDRSAAPATPESARRARLRSLRGTTIQMMGDTITVEEFSRGAGARPEDLVFVLEGMGERGVSVTSSISGEVAEILAEELHCKLAKVTSRFEDAQRTTITDLEQLKQFPQRPAVVTVMGHVDHGKTTLIDWLRTSNIVLGEAGGITQSIGSFLVRANYGGRSSAVCVIDTPGHEAFKQMRERGANVTDIVLLVVAADDGPLETTLEAIDQAKRAEATIIVVINKIDSPQADVKKAKSKLAASGIVVEELGGTTPCVEVSALKGTNMETLVETMIFQADLMDLHANPTAPGEAVCLESSVDRFLGPVAKAVVRWGTMRKGDVIVSGLSSGRVKTMKDEHGRVVDEAKPSTPILLAGLHECPPPGSDILVVENIHRAREVVQARKDKEDRLQNTRRETAVSVESRNLSDEVRNKHAIVLLKADQQGSLDALVYSVEGLKRKGLGVHVVGTGVGPIVNRDILLASGSEAVIIGFNTELERSARMVLRDHKVTVRTHKVIYRILEEIEKLYRVRSQEQFREEMLGTAEVLKVFDFGKKVGLVIGCKVISGEVRVRKTARIKRNGELIFEAPIASVKHFKEEVTAMKSGEECGVAITGATDVREGDIIELAEKKENELEKF